VMPLALVTKRLEAADVPHARAGSEGAEPAGRARRHLRAAAEGVVRHLTRCFDELGSAERSSADHHAPRDSPKCSTRSKRRGDPWSRSSARQPCVLLEQVRCPVRRRHRPRPGHQRPEAEHREVGGDLTGRQPLRRQRQNNLIDTREAALTLAHDLRGERGRRVSRHLDLHRADLSTVLVRLEQLPTAQFATAALRTCLDQRPVRAPSIRRWCSVSTAWTSPSKLICLPKGCGIVRPVCQ